MFIFYLWFPHPPRPTPPKTETPQKELARNGKATSKTETPQKELARNGKATSQPLPQHKDERVKEFQEDGSIIINGQRAYPATEALDIFAAMRST